MENEQFIPSVAVAATSMQRFLAAIIDGVVMAPFFYIHPLVGNLVMVVYGLTKDALPLFDGQSIGKKLIGIRAVKEGSLAPLTNDYGTAIVRSISLWIPLFNIVDALMVLSAERKRFGDKWAKTVVIKVGNSVL